MRTKTLWCVGACLAVGLFWAASSGGQPPSGGADPGRSTDLAPLAPVASPAPPRAEPQNIDQLIKSLADIRRTKAELEKQEQAVLKSLKDRLKEQRDVLRKMGVELDEPPAKVEAKEADLPKIAIPAIVPPPIEPEKK